MSNTTENDVLKMILQGIDPAWRAAATQWVALFTADPGEAGSAITNEAAYTGYARVSLTKAGAWTDGGSTFTNAALVQFPQCSAGSAAVTHFAIVTTASGAGQILVSGSLSGTLAVASGIQPQFAAGALSIGAD
jgi:hypothetical protein